MQSDVVELGASVARGSRKAYWAGWVLSALVILFLTLDAMMKFTHIPAVAQAFLQLGIPGSLAIPLGVCCLCAWGFTRFREPRPWAR